MIADLLLQRLEDLDVVPTPCRYLVAFSGGLDSTVLLHALWQTRDRHGTPIVAVHVNHGLQPRAAEWEKACRNFAVELGIPYLSRTVTVTGSPGGLEAAAREARYTVIEGLMKDGDVVLSAHHQEDQAETLMLNLMRGSGPDGLAGIGAIQPFGRGLLVRPMLDVSRDDIEAYAAGHGLEWSDDPMNEDPRFDRNYLRREILPALRRRWPAVSARLRRSAELLAESRELQAELAQLDLKELGGNPERLDVQGLMRLLPARQRNVLRYAIRRNGLPPAPSTRLTQAVEELLPAPADAEPLVSWPGAELRRYRDTLYILPPLTSTPPPEGLIVRADGSTTPLGETLGILRLEENVAQGIDPAWIGNGLTVRFRKGGEKIRPVGRAHTQALKKLLQEAGIVPWIRERIPLLYADETLVAVADLWVAEEASRSPGYLVCWKNKPRLS